jgi:hypothetical protein
MSSSVDKASSPQSPLSGQNVVYVGVAWSVLSLLFFLLFSITAPGQESPFWYLIGTYVLEILPFLAATLLCYRNWRSPNIASGRNVWLGIGLGMLCYLIAGLLFGWWEVVLGLDPDVSPADLFYLASYVFLGWGMVLAVLPRRLNLEMWQWATVAAIAAAGIAFAVWILLATPTTTDNANANIPPGATQETVTGTTSPQASTPTASGEASPAIAEESEESQAPSWAIAVEDTLSPLSRPVNFFYIVADVFLLIIASTLLLAFWGGRFAQSWRMIAAATFALYIADMGFKYVEARAVEYESGGLLDVFYVFSGVLVAIGAALEYDVSSRSRRGGRKRT